MGRRRYHKVVKLDVFFGDLANMGIWQKNYLLDLSGRRLRPSKSDCDEPIILFLRTITTDCL